MPSFGKNDTDLGINASKCDAIRLESPVSFELASTLPTWLDWNSRKMCETQTKTSGKKICDFYLAMHQSESSGQADKMDYKILLKKIPANNCSSICQTQTSAAALNLQTQFSTLLPASLARSCNQATLKPSISKDARQPGSTVITSFTKLIG